jgi:hypothetical protein
VSILRYANTDSHRTFVDVRQKDVIDPHSIDNFIKKHDKTTLQDVSDFQMSQLFLRHDKVPQQEQQQTPQQTQAPITSQEI